jgi:hypothetical protein
MNPPLDLKVLLDLSEAVCGALSFYGVCTPDSIQALIGKDNRDSVDRPI